MQIIHDFGIPLHEYHKRGLNNQFPVIETCPSCSYPLTLKRHGFYFRNAIYFNKELRIPILRFICYSCKTTFSVLPNFLLPYFQYSLDCIIRFLKSYILKRKSLVNYQLLQFYRRRFIKNLKRIEFFFRDMGFRGAIPGDTKSKAIKLLNMICAFPKAETFSQGFLNHFQQSFMAI